MRPFGTHLRLWAEKWRNWLWTQKWRVTCHAYTTHVISYYLTSIHNLDMTHIFCIHFQVQFITFITLICTCDKVEVKKLHFNEAFPYAFVCTSNKIDQYSGILVWKVILDFFHSWRRSFVVLQYKVNIFLNWWKKARY